MKISLLPLLLPLLLGACARDGAATPQEPAKKDEALSWKAVVSIPKEPGEPLVVSGTVFEPDGETPAPGVDVYFYHTDVGGLYNHGDNDSSRPRLWGRMRTDPRGRYEFRTIKPGPYPNRTPAHIHFELTRKGHPKATPELLFEGDPTITEDMRQSPYFTIRPLTRGEDGILRCQLDMKLAG